MTEDIDDLQRECLKPEMAPRTLFVLGNVLERKKGYMNEAQMRVQIIIEQKFRMLLAALVYPQS